MCMSLSISAGALRRVNHEAQGVHLIRLARKHRVYGGRNHHLSRPRAAPVRLLDAAYN